jgi:hypothetical protein
MKLLLILVGAVSAFCWLASRLLERCDQHTEDWQDEAGGEAAMVKALRWLDRWWCGLTGHHAVLKFERHRLALICTHCGHESPGWSIGKAKAPINLLVVRAARRRAERAA